MSRCLHKARRITRISTQVWTYRLVFYGGAGHTEVQFAILLNAGIDQGLNRALVLKQQECVP